MAQSIPAAVEASVFMLVALLDPVEIWLGLFSIFSENVSLWKANVVERFAY